MTRHERRGTIVLLALIAVLLAATVLLRSCPVSPPRIEVEQDMEQFESEADSAMINVIPDNPVKKRPPKVKTRRSAPAKKSKPAPQPRRLDPVPQF